MRGAAVPPLELERHAPSRARAPAPARLAAAVLAAALAGCTMTPVGPVPEPLPEALAWRVPESGGAFLGLKTEENLAGSLDTMRFEPGVRVVRVVESSPAAAVDVRPGDVILSLDGERFDDPAALDSLVARRAPGARVVLAVQRVDTVFDVPVTLGGTRGAALEPPEVRYRLDPARSRAGWSTRPEGVALVSAAPDSPLPAAGLELGSLVTAVDGEPVASDRALIRALHAREPGAKVVLRVLPPAADGAAEGAARGPARDVTLRLFEPPTRLTRLWLPLLFRYESDVARKRTRVSVLDLLVFELFEYTRENGEKRFVLFEIFGWDLIGFGMGVGELSG